MPVSRARENLDEKIGAQLGRILKSQPLEPLVTRALGPSEPEARNAIGVLRTLARLDRLDAELCLHGLLLQFRDRWDLASAIANELAFFNSERAARALFHEIRTVKSTPASRAYLVQVIRALSRFDPGLVRQEMEALASESISAPRKPGTAAASRRRWGAPTWGGCTPSGRSRSTCGFTTCPSAGW